MTNEIECKHELVNFLRYGCYVMGWGATAWFARCVECNQIVRFPMVAAPNTACSGLAECLANFDNPPNDCTPADGISWDTANR